MTYSQQPERETMQLQANREEMIERIMRAVPADGHIQPLEGLFLFRSSIPRVMFHTLAVPAFCVIAQGSKEIMLGESIYRYDPFHYLISTVELPRFSQILDASSTRPYLSFRLDFDPAVVESVLREGASSLPRRPLDTRATDVCPLDLNLQDAVLRLIRLLEFPAEAPAFMPLITREIILRLLMGHQRDRLCHLVRQDSNTPHIAKAVEKLRRDFDQPLRIEDLAREVGMSVSGLHHHFKAVTELSPLQYQKQIRLQEARRLMLSEGLEAGSAAYRVGYNNASHFSRDYKNLFGYPPMRDVQKLREDVLEIAA